MYIRKNKVQAQKLVGHLMIQICKNIHVNHMEWITGASILTSLYSTWCMFKLATGPTQRVLLHLKPP